MYEKDIKLDFSVNTNPLGPPPAVMRAAEWSARSLCQYPDPCCRELISALSAHDGVPSEMIPCGCGAAELIYAYCEAIKAESALLTAPAFSEYAAVLEAAGTPAVYYPRQKLDGFAVTEDFVAHIEKASCKVISLCNPNNPTGRLISSEG